MRGMGDMDGRGDVHGRGVHGGGGCAWQERRPLQQTLRILLECILLYNIQAQLCGNTCQILFLRQLIVAIGFSNQKDEINAK